MSAINIRLARDSESKAMRVASNHLLDQRTMFSEKTSLTIIIAIILVLVIAARSGIDSNKTEKKHVVPQPLQWSVVNVNSSDCFSTGTPDEWVRELDEPGARAVKTVRDDGSVWITKDLGGGNTSRWELFPTRLACLNSISNYTYVIRH
ncbi:hypothetical protein [Hydrogenophaga pseudoflava]|uniref:hypothetical protein n=1 Tax=Hydrogenophaga pseudoflava TaxID=47421 RepID=UPI0012FA7937|nr:hypothetical protein [Hydrogenophaga pseudoflava]